MSIWCCPTHGLTGPMACCGEASRAIFGKAAADTAPVSPVAPQEPNVRAMSMEEALARGIVVTATPNVRSEWSPSGQPMPVPARYDIGGLEDEQIAELRAIVEAYATAARVIHLHLAEFCDESRHYPDMIADASRKAAVEIVELRAQVASLTTDQTKLLNLLCTYRDHAAMARQAPELCEVDAEEIDAYLAARSSTETPR